MWKTVLFWALVAFAVIGLARLAMATHTGYVRVACWEAKKYNTNKPPVFFIEPQAGDTLAVKAREHIELRHPGGQRIVIFSMGGLVCKALRE